MSKQRNLLDTLMHLFERLTIENEDNHSNHTTTQEIQSGLLEAGYEKKQVNTMLDWLESFNAKIQKESDHVPFKEPQGFRILHDKEKAKIDADAIRYLLKLEQKKRLTPVMREFILSQVM